MRHFVPELKDFPAKHIYEPWKAPIQDQRKAGCLIKGDDVGEEGEYRVYPKPMFDFAERRKVCIDGMKNAYDVGLYGNDPKVLDGSWRSLFSDSAEGPTEGKKGLAGAMLEDEDADGHEENQVDVKSSGRRGAGKKRSAGQSTLDGHVRKAKK